MNIMKTNMLLLDNKIMKEDTGSTTVTPAPVPAEDTSKAGMKALSFLGMKNLMANPKLAQGVGVMNDKMAETTSADSYVAPYSSNIAFQGGMKNAAKIASVAALTAMAAAALTSCERDFNVSQNQTVVVDLDALVVAVDNAVASMRAEFEALKDMLAKQNAALIAVLQNAINKLEDLGTQLKNNQISFEQFKAELHADNSAIIEAIVNFQNVSKEEAKAQVDRILEALEKGQINEQEAMSQIMALIVTNNELLADIKAEIKNLVAEAKKTNESLDSLKTLSNKAIEEIVKYGKISEYQGYIMINQLGITIQQNNAQLAYENKIYKAIKEGNADLKATIYEVAQNLGVKIDDVIEAIQVTGKSVEEIITMSKEDILKALEAHIAQVERINTNLIDVDNSVKNQTITIEKAAEEIADILNEINAKLDTLISQFGSALNDYKSVLNKIAYYTKGNYINTTAIKNSMPELKKSLAIVNKYLAELEYQIENQKGNEFDYDKLQEMFNDLGTQLNMQSVANKDELLAEIKKIRKSNESIEMYLNKYGDKLFNADGIIAAIQEASESNKISIAEAADKIAAEIEAVVKAINDGFDDLRGLVPTWKAYMDKILEKLNPMEDILAAIKANGKKIDVTNKNTAELKAEMEKLKPYIEELLANAKTANSYLEVIAPKAVEIAQTAKNIEAKLGRALTKDELQELWLEHDANAKAYIDGLHIENLAKADEEIGYIKEGNKIALDIYNKLKDFAEKEGLSDGDMQAWLKAIYEYLPELICKCNCQGNCNNNQTVNEGIIDIIQ